MVGAFKPRDSIWVDSLDTCAWRCNRGFIRFNATYCQPCEKASPSSSSLNLKPLKK